MDKKKQYNVTDLGNAERMEACFGEHIRYVHDWRKWVVWDGTKWAKVPNEAIYNLAQQTVREMTNQAYQEQDTGAIIKQLLHHAQRSESYSSVRNMCEALKAFPSIIMDSASFDINPMLLNVENGTVDLKTGELLPHNKEDYITKLAQVVHNSNSVAQTFSKFMQQITLEDDSLTKYLQRVLGYSISGNTREQVLFLFFGEGANGKSTLITTIQQLLGDYAQQAPAIVLMKQSLNKIPNDVAKLKGCYIAVISEIEENDILAESRIKQITGGDKISARFLHAEWFEFIPMCKIFVTLNHLPQINGQDEGIWRRLQIIPFDAFFAENERDKGLPEKLKQEASGILNWLIQGCLDWQKDGLSPPDRIINAVGDYRANYDSVYSFLQDCCIKKPDIKIKSSALYQAYVEWCREGNGRLVTQKAFSSRLIKRGFTVTKSNVNHFCGIGLK